MNFIKIISTFLITIIMSTTTFGQGTKPTNYLGTQNSIMFDNIAYNLTWTSHPADNYYKQEYLAKGDTIEKFKKLVLLETITGKIKLSDVVSAKVAELKKMKETNPVVNYEMFEKDGEVILDFLVSTNTPDGKYLSIVERNVYRYQSIKEKNGQKCVLLFGVSERAYGDDIDNFFPKLKENRFDLINLVGQFQMQEIKKAVIALIEKEKLSIGENSSVKPRTKAEIKNFVLTESKEGGQLDFFTEIKGHENDGIQVKSGVYDTKLGIALYKWGRANFEIETNTIEDTFEFWSELKQRKINDKEKVYIKMGFNKELEK